jgi:hypothetical protein
MELQLNPTREAYKSFPKNGTDQYRRLMPQVIADKRAPLSVSDIMLAKISAVNAEDAVKSAWFNNYLDTGDGIADHPDGRSKLVLDSQHLRNLTSDTPLIDGALPLEDGVYETLPGLEFSKEDKEKYFGRAFISKLVKSNPFWQALARDSALLDAFVDIIATEYQRKFAPNEDLGKLELMGAYLRDEAPKSPQMRALYVSGLGGWSNVYGRVDLDDLNGRLVGLAPEAQGARNFTVPETRIVAPTLDQVLALSNAHVSRNGKPEFEKDVRGLYKQ